MNFVYAYQAYAVYPITYGLTIQWLIYGFIESILLGILVSLTYKLSQTASA